MDWKMKLLRFSRAVRPSFDHFSGVGVQSGSHHMAASTTRTPIIVSFAHFEKSVGISRALGPFHVTERQLFPP